MINWLNSRIPGLSESLRLDNGPTLTKHVPLRGHIIDENNKNSATADHGLTVHDILIYSNSGFSTDSWLAFMYCYGTQYE